MSLKYVYQSSRSELQRDPLADGETFYEGEFVTRNSEGELARFDLANDSLPDGIVVHNPGGDSIVEHDEDYVDYEDLWQYDGADGDRAYYLPLGPGVQIMPETLSDTSMTEPAIGDGTVVGVVTAGASGKTEIVEEGYTDSGTTYNESNNNFVALGRIYQEPQSLRIEDAYGQRVPVQLDQTHFQP